MWCYPKEPAKPLLQLTDSEVALLQDAAKPCVLCKHYGLGYVDGTIPAQIEPTHECLHPKLLSVDTITGKITTSLCEHQRDCDGETPSYCGQEGYHFQKKEINDVTS